MKSLPAFTLFGGLSLLAGCQSGSSPTLDMASIWGDSGPVSTDLAGTTPDTFTLALTPFTVPPGEVYKCQDFANPFGGDVEVKEWESHMTPGSHHLILFYKAGAVDRPIEECSGLEFAGGPYGSQRPDDDVRYPDGVAALVPASTGFRLQAHYVNATQQPINATVKVILHKAIPGTVTDHAGLFFYNNVNLAIPSQPTPTTVTKSCTAKSDMKVILAQSHMHQHATGFTATAGGMMVYQTDKWSDPPPQAYSPPMTWPKGTQITFSCTYMNTTGTTLTFGESALTNEMCIFSGQFYPATGEVTCF